MTCMLHSWTLYIDNEMHDYEPCTHMIYINWLWEHVFDVHTYTNKCSHMWCICDAFGVHVVYIWMQTHLEGVYVYGSGVYFVPLYMYIYAYVFACELCSQKQCEFRYLLWQGTLLSASVFWHSLKEKLYCLRAANCTDHIFLSGFLMILPVTHSINVQTLKSIFLLRQMHIQLLLDTDVLSW